MKFQIVFALLLVACANANFLDDVLNELKQVQGNAQRNTVGLTDSLRGLLDNLGNTGNDLTGRIRGGFNGLNNGQITDTLNNLQGRVMDNLNGLQKNVRDNLNGLINLDLNKLLANIMSILRPYLESLNKLTNGLLNGLLN